MLYQCLDAVRVDILDQRLDLNLAIDTLQFLFGGNGFRQMACDILLIEEDLALQIAYFNVVAIGDG